MKKLWPAWLVTLLSFVFAIVIISALSGFSDTKDAYQAGQEAGRKYAFIALLFPLVAYIVQKVRIDNAKEQAMKQVNDNDRIGRL